jgi:spore germination protein
MNRLAFCLFLILILSGCSFLPTNIVNEIEMSQGVGYDLAGKKGIKGTIVFPIFKKDKTSTTEVRTAIGKSSKEIRSILNNDSLSIGKWSASCSTLWQKYCKERDY